MIRFKDAELISVLPYYVRSDADVQAISYAFRIGMSKLIAYAALSTLYGDIDSLPEQILDLMALELQSQYYDESMGIETKREIIKKTISWHAKGGTLSAVQEVIETVFGEGKVVEWDAFDGEPGTFYIETNAELSSEGLQRFQEIIAKVKNSSSHLVGVKVNRKINQPRYVGITGYIHSHVRVYGAYARIERTVRQSERVGIVGYIHRCLNADGR